MKLPLYQVDSFTQVLFKGNPAAVVLLEDWLSETTMQAIATENNLAETAFLKPLSKELYAIRYFSPICEVPLCGHATLASSFVLFNENQQLTKITFITAKQEQLNVKKKQNALLEMSFPKKPAMTLDTLPNELLASLSIKPHSVLQNEQAYFALYESEQAIYDLKVNTELLKKLAPYSLVVTAKGTEYDFILRYFAPAHGLAEDPVTGSIHTGLTPYWAEQLHKKQLRSYQASARGGVIFTEELVDKVLIAGHAKLYAKAIIELV